MAQFAALYLLLIPGGAWEGRWGGRCGALLVDNCVVVCAHMDAINESAYLQNSVKENKKNNTFCLYRLIILTKYRFSAKNRCQKLSSSLVISSWHSQWPGKLSYFCCGVEGCFFTFFFHRASGGVCSCHLNAHMGRVVLRWGWSTWLPQSHF